MVEAQLFDPLSRGATPTPNSFRSRRLRSHSQEPQFDSLGSSRHSPDFYDRSRPHSPIIPEPAINSGSDSDASSGSMHRDAKNNMSESSLSGHAKSGSNRRRSRSQLATSIPRPPGTYPSQPSASHGYVSSPPIPSENVHNRPPTSFQGPFPPPPVSYAQPGSYGPYTMSAQPSPINMSPSPSPYSYPHPYHTVVPDGNMMAQGMHANYQQMLQPHGTIYQYPRPSPDGTSRSPSMYSSHQGNASPSLSSSHIASSSLQNTALSPSYASPNQFHTLRYPSPMPTTFGYPHHQSFSSYSSPFSAPPPFGQPYPSTSEAEPPGGTWFYLPHTTPMPSPPLFDGGSAYPGHYPVPFSLIGPPDGDNTYGTPSPSNPGTSAPPNSSSQIPQQSDLPVDSARGYGLSPGSGQPSNAPSNASRAPLGERQLVRRPYHPNPPASRSEWVMWAGNVPADATHDELWRFFTESNDSSGSSGVVSIFLISRSSCAFINYQTETDLRAAIGRFNAVPLRPNDARCPRLVCRVRRKDDDLKAGVGAQRGMGMHVRWIKEQKNKAQEDSRDVPDLDPSTSPSSISERMARAVSNISLSSDEEPRRPPHPKTSSSSGSYASTNSSILTRHFPRRFFILKSLTQHDLDLSVQRGLWATQKHNEGILDQAFRTSKDVYLIFGVNKSGEFYGYARMAGPVRHSDERVSWASRESSRSSQSPPSKHLSSTPKSAELLFSPSDHRLVDSSPLPVDEVGSGQGEPRQHQHQSAPALLGEHYDPLTVPTPPAKLSYDPIFRLRPSRRPMSSAQDHFELNPEAPVKARRANQPADAGEDEDPKAFPSLQEIERRSQENTGPGKPEDAWGECFAVEWLSTEKLPFHRTRHLRNPWNHDREVKVSRDGTELEPTVGQQLIDEWARLAEPVLPNAGPSKPSTSKRGASSKPPPQVDGMVLHDHDTRLKNTSAPA